MKTYIQILLVIYLFTSCKPSFDKESIQKCSNYKVNNSSFYKIDSDSIDFYKSIADVEKIMISNGILQNRSKIAYKDGIAKIDSKSMSSEQLEELKNKMDESFVNNHFSYISGSVNNLIFNCFEFGFKDSLVNHKKSSLFLQRERADYMFANTGLYYDKKSLYSLIDAVDDKDFKNNIIFRAPLIMLTYDNIEEMLSENLQPNYRNKIK